VVDSEKEGPREQRNYGSGPFIGRDNYGPIRYEMLDPKTKAMIAKLSEDAPGLADLLRRALSEGIISPDVADALMLAVRNINEDVADALVFAGRNINEDVANTIAQAAETISKATDRFDYVSSSINRTVDEVNNWVGLDHLARLEGTLTGAAERIERVFTPEIIIDRRGKFKAFLMGVVVGVLTVVILIGFHVKPF
jgi:hypothetical protein